MLIKNCEVRKVISKVLFYVIIYYQALHQTHQSTSALGRGFSRCELRQLVYVELNNVYIYISK